MKRSESQPELPARESLHESTSSFEARAMPSHLGKRSPNGLFHPEVRPPFAKCRPHPEVRGVSRASKERTAVAQDEEGTSKERRFF